METPHYAKALPVLPTRQLRAAAITALCILISGCANAPIYSEARDKQGQAAKKAWSDIDVRGVIATARDNLSTLLQRSLGTQDKLVLARRDQLIRSMSTGGTVQAQLVAPVASGLARLAGSPARAAAWTAAWDAQELARVAVAAAAREMSGVGVEMPSCPEINARKKDAFDALQQHIDNGGPKGSTVDGALKAAIVACAHKDIDATAAAVVDVGRAIRQSYDLVATAVAELESAKSKTRDQRNAYKAALDAHEKAIAELKVNADARQRVQEAAAKLHKAIDPIVAAADVFSIRFLSEQRVDSLNRFLAAVAETKAGEPPPEGASKAAAALILFPSWYDETRKALSDARTPTLAPLVLEKTLQKIKLDAATRDIALLEAGVELRRQKLALQTQQAAQYLNAAVGLDVADKRFHPMTLDAALAPPNAQAARHADVAARQRADAADRDQRNTLLHAAALYLDAEGRLRGEVGKIDERLQAAAYERALAYSESNAAQWETLIASGVDQLAVQAASGIKPDMIVALLNSLALLWIGVGVH